MPQLMSITFMNAPEIQGIRQGGFLRIHCLKNGPLSGWRAAVRGASVILIGPPRPVSGATTQSVALVEVPRAQCQLEWSCSPGPVDPELDEILKAGKFITPPFGEPKVEGDPL